MLKEAPKRVTYAQQKLLNLVTARQLRKWCLDNGLTHPTIYNLAFGNIIPTYKIVSDLSHLIAPIDWLYYTDEELPFPETLVPKWNYKSISKYVEEHRFNYKTIAEQYNLEELNAYNIFVAHRAKPSIDFIKQVSKNTDPIEFFVESKITEQKKYIPLSGDIVSFEENLYFIFSVINRGNDIYCYCCHISINQDISKDYISLDIQKQKYYINTLKLRTLLYKKNYNRNNINYISSCPEKVINKVLELIKNNINYT